VEGEGSGRSGVEGKIHAVIGTEQILLGLLSESEGVAVQVLKHFNIDAARMRSDLLRFLAVFSG
jgi:ATP-dependent Clp protease ATP-binding subunit ClpA